MAEEPHYYDPHQTDPNLVGVGPSDYVISSRPTTQISADISSLVDDEETIERILLALQSKYISQDQDGNIITNSFGEPLINDVGIAIIRSILSSILTKVSKLSKYSIDWVNEYMKNFLWSLTSLLIINRRKFNVKIENVPIIVSIIEAPIYASLVRGVSTISDKELLGGIVSIGGREKPSSISSTIKEAIIRRSKY